MADYDLLPMGAPFESKRIFVTGGTGFLGGAVRRSLAERGVTDVIAPSSTDVDFRSHATFAVRPLIVFLRLHDADANAK